MVHVMVVVALWPMVVASAVELTETEPLGLSVNVSGTPMMETVVLAWRVPPPTVMQLRMNRAAEFRGGVVAVPLTLVLFAFCAVNAGRSGLEMTHDCMPDVTQPSRDAVEGATAFGFATNTIDGLPTCTVHCADAVWPGLLLLHPIL